MSTNTNTNKNANELGALWKKKSKTGLSFLSGYITDHDGQRTDVVVFANSKKSNERAPDYRLYLSKPLGEKSSDVNKTKAGQKTVEVIEEDSIL
jgi:uncharacterized protein (DUF736 family)